MKIQKKFLIFTKNIDNSINIHYNEYTKREVLMYFIWSIQAISWN